LRGRQWESTKQLTPRKRQTASILWLVVANTVILLREGLSHFAFRRLSEKQKKPKALRPLCLCGKKIYKDPFRVTIKPPLLGVVIDYFPIAGRSII
jgi:hypothetical protein